MSEQTTVTKTIAKAYYEIYGPHSNQSWPFIGGFGCSSISGMGYSISCFIDDSSVLEVKKKIIDFSNLPVTQRVIDTWAHLGRCLNEVSKQKRAEIVKIEIAKQNPKLNYAIIENIKWDVNGDFVGLNWAEN